MRCAAPALVRSVLDEQVLAPPGDSRGQRCCRASGCRWASCWDHGPGALEDLAEIDPDASLQIVLATRSVSFRKLYGESAGAVEHELGLDPYSGVVLIPEGGTG